MRWQQAGFGYRLPPHAPILTIPQQWWLDDEAARQIDAFIQTSRPLVDSVYQWTASQG
jgi:hypothetical protein